MYCFDRQAVPVQVTLNDTSLKECARVCKEAPHCAAFTHNDQTCVLQGAFVPSDTVYYTKTLWGGDRAGEAAFRL